jgi:proton-translocating NADH-quinone oxidoreductase chain N
VTSELALWPVVWRLAPELLLLATGLLILTLDLLQWSRLYRGGAFVLAFAGATAALVAALSLWGAQPGRVLHVLTCDAAVLVIRALALFALLVLLLISEDYVREHLREAPLFYALLLFCVQAVLLLSESVNLVMLVLAFEFLSLSSYALTGFLHYDTRSTEASIKYLIYGAILSGVMLYALSWLYGVTGSTDMFYIGQVLGEFELWLQGQGVSPAILSPILILLVAGLGFKVAAAPFHQWAPDAYEGAPVPVTALLAVGPKIAGFVILARVTLTLFPEATMLGGIWRRPLLMVLAALAMTLGNLAALAQDNIRRLMAYSGVAQAGYMLVGVLVSTELGLTALILYLGVYVLAELGAFAVILSVFNHTDSDWIASYRGLWHRARWPAVVLLVSLLSLAGFPGTGGFFAKLLLFSAAVEADAVWLAGLGLANSLFSLAYYWKIIRATWVQPPLADADPIPVTPRHAVAMGVTLGGVMLLGLLPHVATPFARAAARAFLGGP